MHISQFHYLPLAPGFFSILVAVVTMAGMNTGTAMPTPGTGLASQCSTTATMASELPPRRH